MSHYKLSEFRGEMADSILFQEVLNGEPRKIWCNKTKGYKILLGPYKKGTRVA